MHDVSAYIKMYFHLNLWGMWSTPSLPLIPGPSRSGVVVPDRILSMGQIEVWHLNWEQTNDLGLIELLEIELFDHLTVCI